MDLSKKIVKILSVEGKNMSIQPKYHWTFREIQNSATQDTISGAPAQLSNVTSSGQGRIGNAVALNGSDDSYISLGREIGQFGTKDFTVAFGVKIAPTDKWIVLLSNREGGSHSNFFNILFAPEGRICAEVDEDRNGKNYIWLYNDPNNPSGLDNDTWHHVAVVRKQKTLKLYINGNLSAEGTANGVTNIANGNELTAGKSSKIEFEDLRIYDCALSDQQVLEVFLLKYHWTFERVRNSATQDTISGATARLFNVTLREQGRIGSAVALNGSDDSYISLDGEIGQFGTKDFTVAFGAKIAATERLVELLGNRTAAGHGNFFCIRVTPEGKVSAEVDQDSSGTNYIWLCNQPNNPSGLDNDTWHHITVVRQQRTLKLYIDGRFSGEGTASGVANIANGNELRVGNLNPGGNGSASTPTAEFEDLRIYAQALSNQQVSELVQRVSTLIPSLKQGEIELKTPNDFSQTWVNNVNDLSLFSTEFEKLRLGPDTGVTLYKDANFSGISQEVAADLPKFSDTRLGTPPKSIRVWSTVGKPFTGKWAILTPSGQYLSLAKPPLTTSFCVTAHELFDFRVNVERQYMQLVSGSSSQQVWNALRIVNNAGLSQGLLCVEKEVGFHCFSLVNEHRDRWLKCSPTNRIALRALSGKYLRADIDNGGGFVDADRDYLLPSEYFELIPSGSEMGKEIIYLRTSPNGLFVNANGSHITLTGSSPKAFTLDKLEGNKISLKYTSYGQWGEQQGDRRINREGQMNYYISAVSGASRVFGSPSRRDSETFELIRLEAFDWTTNRDDRAIFTRAIKIAENESQVGELLPGEAAFYEQPAYWGKAWILYSSCSDFRAIEGLNDTVSSIRLGPQTGATLYSDVNYGEGSQDREKDITDIIENIPAFSQDAQVGNDKLSSMRFWSNIPPTQANVSFSISLSQDYKLVGEDLQEFTSYRSILKFLPEVTEVEVWATDLTTIEVDGKTFEVDEDRSVKLPPNGMNRLMITSEADGINTPGLKIRTNTMQSHERVVIFPDREVHHQLASLKDGALWEAKDAQGKLLVNRSTYSADAVANVQQTITKTMKTLSYVAAESEGKDQVIDREVSANAIHQPWKLSFTPDETVKSYRIETAAATQSDETVTATQSIEPVLGIPMALIPKAPPLTPKNRQVLPKTPSTKSDQPSFSVVHLIQEQELSQDDFTQLLAQASAPPSSGIFQ
jgi:hypothetical protein